MIKDIALLSFPMHPRPRFNVVRSQLKIGKCLSLEQRLPISNKVVRLVNKVITNLDFKCQIKLYLPVDSAINIF